MTPHTSDVERLVVSIAEACESWLASRGYGEDDEADGEAEADDAQAVLQQASLLGMAALGPRAGKAARKIQIFRVDAYACPGCAKPMRVRTVILESRLATKLLGALERSTGPP